MVIMSTTNAVGGLRTTRQRRAVSAALDDLDSFCSAQQIHHLMAHQGDEVGLSTVYRSLQTLAEAGEVDAIRNADGEVLYRRCRSDQHHHHLVCRQCGRAVEVAGPAVEKWADKVGAENDFVEVAHTIEVFGTCRQCHEDPSRSVSTVR